MFEYYSLFNSFRQLPNMREVDTEPDVCDTNVIYLVDYYEFINNS